MNPKQKSQAAAKGDLALVGPFAVAR